MRYPCPRRALVARVWHLLSKRPPQVIAKVRKEELGGRGSRWEDNIFQEAHSQLVTSWTRVLQSLSPCPCATNTTTRTVLTPSQEARRDFIHSNRRRLSPNFQMPSLRSANK